jgi:hypothetical protein
MRLKEWRFALGWNGWRKTINARAGVAYQIVNETGFDGLVVRVELLEGGQIGRRFEHRDRARRMTLHLSEREARALMIELRERLIARGVTL